MLESAKNAFYIFNAMAVNRSQRLHVNKPAHIGRRPCPSSISATLVSALRSGRDYCCCCCCCCWLSLSGLRAYTERRPWRDHDRAASAGLLGGWFFARVVESDKFVFVHSHSSEQSDELLLSENTALDWWRFAIWGISGNSSIGGRFDRETGLARETFGRDSGE